MIDNFFNELINVLQTFSGEFNSFVLFAVCVLGILIACRYGFVGLCTYNVLAMIFGNIQALRHGTFMTSPEPVALGTVLFATTFLVSDIITEYMSAKRARQCIMACFIAQIFVILWMVIGLGHAGPNDPSQTAMTHALTLVFLPQTRFIASSIISYIICQLVDISIFQWIKKRTHTKHLWLRQNISLFISGFLDNLIFSLLAWVVLNPEPMEFHKVMMAYVLSGYIIRIAINILGTPVLYLSKYFMPK